MPAHVGPIDPTRPIDIEIAGLSSHVIAFALWSRLPDRDTWTVLGQGRTGDGTFGPHILTLDGIPHAQIYYWIAASNPARPHAAFHARVRISQHGAVVSHGEIDIHGTTDAAGNESVEEWIDLL
ncbi:MAG TPA: hypothetical protein VIC55_06335 [Gemmatimonadaceae bacterium]|jgi:hypothetical protein